MSHGVIGKTRAVLRHTAAASVAEIYWNEVQLWEETENQLQRGVMMGRLCNGAQHRDTHIGLQSDLLKEI